MKSHAVLRATPVALVAAALLCLVAVPAQAGISKTSGKVYMQQKVYDKAAFFLEKAREEDPKDVEVYPLLSFARAQLRQYRSAGASFQIGIQLATEKKDKKSLENLNGNRLSVTAQLFNAGIAALNRAGNVTAEDQRTTGDESSPYGKLEKEYGPPRDYARINEGSRAHEFWYYPDKGKIFHFSPNSDEPVEMPYEPYRGLGDPNKEISDTTVFSPYTGGSYLEEAAYDFELASYIDPTSVDTYQNLGYVLGVLGRVDDAIAVSKRGLASRPGDQRLERNLRAAVMSRGNRLFGAGNYRAAIQAYQDAVSVDSSSALGYMSRIADAWYKYAEPLPKGPERLAAYDSAAAAYQRLLDITPPDSAEARQNALYNAAVIYMQLENYPKAIEVLDRAVQLYPHNRDMLSLDGEAKFRSEDYAGAVTLLRRAVEVDPRDPANHQFLFHALQKLDKKEESVSEYMMYRALSGGTKKTNLKVWVDSADNRLGAENQLKTTLASDGYPEEVYTFTEDNKPFESWFYWSKGKAVTFMEGKVLSKGAFPPKHPG
jgi:tetratricopeptide (TPR) repeat protein